MYSQRIEGEHIRRLFWLKEGFKSLGVKITMVGLVREALDRYLSSKEEELEQKLANKNERV